MFAIFEGHARAHHLFEEASSHEHETRSQLALFLHSWERMVAYVLLLAGISIQVMLLVAAIVAVA